MACTINLFTVVPALLGMCYANGDFGRLKPGLVADDIHGWMGRDAAAEAGVPPSVFPLTDEERNLRDLAYPLIEPPFDRGRWYAIINEYGVSHIFGWPRFEIERYSGELFFKWYRSASARYAKLNGDIRNDTLRIPEFARVAKRVVDLDRKRQQSLRYVAGLTPYEAGNATARMAENQLVIGWVQGALAERAAGYCYALQRLVIATPAPMAVEVERSLSLLHARIIENRVLATPQFGPEPVGCGPAIGVPPPVAAIGPPPVVTK